MWLSLQNCLKTWDNIIKKRWIGKNLCSLYRKVEETVDHLLVNCSFSINIWKTVCIALSIQRNWEGDNFNHSCYTWFKNCRDFHSLHAIVSWKIWNVRNTNIFEDHLQDQSSICIQNLKYGKRATHEEGNFYKTEGYERYSEYRCIQFL